MENKGLTLSIICELESANYGEGGSNYSSLKKISRADGNIYTYISRQALRYSIVEQLMDEYGWNKTDVEPKGKGNKKVVQFAPNSNIKEFEEIDLFGYMKTDAETSSDTRRAVVRLSNAISLEPYSSNLDFLTNSGLAKRKNLDNSLVQVEIHKSLYAYTITIDLNKVGIDEIKSAKEPIEILPKEKAKRVKDLLNVIKLLYRNIRGRRETLIPVFIIGGVYNIKNPFFDNKLNLIKNTIDLDINTIKNTLENIDNEIKNNTIIGYLGSVFNNSEDIKKAFNPKTIKEVFDLLLKEVDKYYV
ncbi:type I-B CRISPR-associated protein Cas7/Cst2/DevR [Brachyspira aalborgi]|uniref:type I-B CRISPR-associated protein Cas7/Cst2/DevR n=1 Tax=Brachyspira aalborgi TaxID=29522 RepID=UPI0011CCC848|nr:type I-B CRISPR-associated protein Cas7/Cst2/DevR [Brachyspira aalborgi]TXJ52717.1 type I-B CRISPR-associated protein Cas7/Cst2/DevR [Brachyspira aalborgi]